MSGTYCSDEDAHAARPDERAEVDGGAPLLERVEVTADRAELGRVAVHRVEVLPAREHPVVERRDRLALARDLGRDALGDLGGHTLVDERRVLRLAEEVDET